MWRVFSSGKHVTSDVMEIFQFLVHKAMQNERRWKHGKLIIMSFPEPIVQIPSPVLYEEYPDFFILWKLLIDRVENLRATQLPS